MPASANAMSSGIGFIDSHRLVSRDIKPAKFLVGRDGYLVMTGLRVAEKEGTRRGLTGKGSYPASGARIDTTMSPGWKSRRLAVKWCHGLRDARSNAGVCCPTIHSPSGRPLSLT